MKSSFDVSLSIEDYNEIPYKVLKLAFNYELNSAKNATNKPKWFKEGVNDNTHFINYCNYLSIREKNGKYYTNIKY